MSRNYAYHLLVVQEIGREGILPFSRLWSSNKPFNTPFMGIFEHWLVAVVIMLAPPPGDAYNFILKYVLNLCNSCHHITNITQCYLVSTCLGECLRIPGFAYPLCSTILS